MDWGERCTRDSARARVRRRMASDDSRRQAQARSRDVEGKGASAGTHQSRNRGTARSQARRSGGGKSADRGGTRRRRDLLHLRFGPLSERKGIRAGRRNLHVEGRVISFVRWFVILNHVLFVIPSEGCRSQRINAERFSLPPSKALFCHSPRASRRIPIFSFSKKC